jgi:prepilin-type N-terminal cleavage/methylation domain-containing protein
MKHLNRRRKSDSATRDQGNKGFTLIELVVAMVLFLIVTGSIYGLLQVGRTDRNRSSRRSDILKNARIAIHLIGRDALNGGLGYHRRGAVAPDGFLNSRFGIAPDPDTDRDLVTSIMVGDNVFPNDLSTAVTDTVVFVSRDLNFNAPAPSPGIVPVGETIDLTDVSFPGGAPGTPRLKAKTATGAAAAAQYDLYLVESDTSQVAIMATQVSGTDTIDAAPGDPLGLNQPLNGVGAAGSVLRKCNPPTTDDPPVLDEYCTTYIAGLNSATLKRFFMVGYRVTQDGTLMRTLYGNNRGAAAAAQIIEQPLAYNVQDLQIQYVLKDGTVTSNPVAGADGVFGNSDDDQDAVNRIRQITVTVRVQSTESDEQTQRPEVITLTATFSTRNMEYDAS